MVCTMLEIAFGKSENPDIYIISPFTTVVKGLKSYIKSYSGIKKDWKLEDHIGTVHTFQGKEAEEVIFVLGCDKSEKAAGAIRWVNKNIVNVAVTRAKYRLYVIGDKEAWSKSPHLGLVMKYLENNELNPIVSSE